MLTLQTAQRAVTQNDVHMVAPSVMVDTDCVV
jgi:hypothetical protein